MKNLIRALAILCIALSYPSLSISSGDHDRDNESEHNDEHEKHEDHKSEDHKSEDHKSEDHKSEDHDEHAKESGHAHEEGSSAVGPDKGITEKSENGFKLSVEASKTMDIKTQAVSSTNLAIDKKTLVLVKGEKSVFRVRDGWIKRVHVQIVSLLNNSVTISSTELKAGDEIVIHGTGFLRIAEVFATEGASHGHSH